jgi:ribonuclease E
MDRLEVPPGMSLIARTAGIGRTVEELQWDLNYLLQLWRAIESAASSQKGPFLIYQEGSLVIRAIRDYFQPDIGEILIDTDEIFEQARQFMSHVMPANVARVKRYRDDVPLFSRFQIEHQIETAFGRQVTLPSGGAVVIDHTEALVAIDVNSGRATRGADIEETALRTNLEAAEEIARQLRLRDLGGLIVIDFIDMESPRAQREVENRLREALHYDRARVQTGKISRFGLLELSRQRLRPALAEMSYIPCPRCTGTGHIRSTESAALHILRILEEEAMKENTGAVHAQIPVDVATFLLNEKRDDIRTIELRHKVNLVLIPNIHLETPAHEIVRLRHDQLNQEDKTVPSYKMVEAPTSEAYQPPSAQTDTRPNRPEAAVKGITPSQPAPVVEPKSATQASRPTRVTKEGGLFERILGWFRRSRNIAAEEPAKQEQPSSRGQQRAGRGERGRGRGGERGRTEPTRERQEQQRPRAQQTPPDQQEGRVERRLRQERGENAERQGQESRQPRQPRQQEQPRPSPLQSAESPMAAAAVESATAAVAAEQQEERRGRRGRRGRSRDRSGRRPEAETGTGPQASASEQPALAGAAHPVEAQAPLAFEGPAATPEMQKAEPPPSPVPLPERDGTAKTPSIQRMEPALAPVVPSAEPTAAPIVESAAPAVPPPRPAAPRPLEQIAVELQQSGLVMVQTHPDKMTAPTPGEPEIRLGRKPKPVAPVADEPLVQVETRK